MGREVVANASRAFTEFAPRLKASLGGAILFAFNMVEGTEFDILNREVFEAKFKTIPWSEFLLHEAQEHALFKDWLTGRQQDNELRELQTLFAEDEAKWKTSTSPSDDAMMMKPGQGKNHEELAELHALKFEQCGNFESSGFVSKTECAQAILVEGFATLSSYRDSELQSYGLRGALPTDIIYFHRASLLGMEPHLNYMVEGTCPTGTTEPNRFATKRGGGGRSSSGTN
eukprot:g9250.t1